MISKEMLLQRIRRLDKDKFTVILEEIVYQLPDYDDHAAHVKLAEEYYKKEINRKLFGENNLEMTFDGVERDDLWKNTNADWEMQFNYSNVGGSLRRKEREKVKEFIRAEFQKIAKELKDCPIRFGCNILDYEGKEVFKKRGVEV